MHTHPSFRASSLSLKISIDTPIIITILWRLSNDAIECSQANTWPNRFHYSVIMIIILLRRYFFFSISIIVQILREFQQTKKEKHMLYVEIKSTYDDLFKKTISLDSMWDRAKREREEKSKNNKLICTKYITNRKKNLLIVMNSLTLFHKNQKYVTFDQEK
jgi:hypothetical protein